MLGRAEHGERFACAIARPPLYGVQFHPEKSSAAGLRLLANFAADLRTGRSGRLGVILYPAIDIRGGHAVRLSRATTTARRPSTPTRSTPPAAGSSRAPGRCTSSTSTARAGAPVNIEHVGADLRRGRRPGPGRRGPARGGRRRRGARRRRRAGDPRDGGARRPGAGRGARRRARRADRRLASTPRPAGSRSRAGSARPAIRRRPDRRARRRGVRALRLHPGRGRRDAGGPRARGAARSRRRAGRRPS